MKTVCMLVLLAVALATAGAVAPAAPSLGGPTGVVSTPNAEVAEPGWLQTAISYQSLKVEGSGAGDPSESWSVWKLQALSALSERGEIWAGYGRVRDAAVGRQWGIGAKLQVSEVVSGSPVLAIGGMYASSSGPGDGDGKVRNAYIVATKELTPMGAEGWGWGPGGGTRTLGSVGLLHISCDSDVAGGQDLRLTRPFVNLDFRGTGGTDVGLEYRWADNEMDEKAVFSAVLRHAFSPEVSGEIGTTNASVSGTGLDDQDWFLRLGYTIPLGGVQ